MILKRVIKALLKMIPGVRRLRYTYLHAKWLNWHQERLGKSSKKSLLFYMLKTHIVLGHGATPQTRAADAFFRMCKSIHLQRSTSERFQYSLDSYTALIPDPGTAVIGNITINYGSFLEGGFIALENAVHAAMNIHGKTDFLQGSLKTIGGLRFLAARIQKFSEADPDLIRASRVKRAFSGMENSAAASLEDALQRILFLNQLLWQCQHGLNGLGRLDQILLHYYKMDLEIKGTTRNSALAAIKDFLALLHENYELKSSVLLGDTGQIVILGGLMADGRDACNELTELFLEAVGELHLPDPKVLFRVSSKTPRHFWSEAVHCLEKRTGSPLFSNDDVVIPSLVAYGYPLEDARNYGTAACWEPLIPGRSLDQGNLASLVFPACLPKALESTVSLNSEEDFEYFLRLCEKELRNQVRLLLESNNHLRWCPAPFLSLFLDDCIGASKDVSEGGALFNNYGFTTVGLGNLVDSVANLHRLIIEEHSISFADLKIALHENFNDFRLLWDCLKEQSSRYGCDDPGVISFARRFLQIVEEEVHGRRNCLGGLFKFGLSSPNYVNSSSKFPATPDGRRNGEPFYVHISSGVAGQSPTDLVRFAGKLDYSGSKFNGNVVDFVLDPRLIESAEDKFCDFLEGAVRCGFFQMQMTIIDSATIYAAMKDPDKFPDLIVRVWGFSAYFKDLPQEYRQVVLERTLRSEAACR